MKIVQSVLFVCVALLLSSIIKCEAQTVLYNQGDIYIQTGESVYVNGGFENSGSGQVTNAGTLYVSGDWANNASNQVFPTATGLVRLNGGNQNIGGSNATGFGDLILEGTGIKTLNINTEIAGTLALNDREFATQNYTLTVLSSAANSVTRTTGFVSTSASGALIRNTNGATTWLFPLGSSSPALGYRPVEINPYGGGTGAFSTTLVNDNPSNHGYNITLFQSPVCIVNHKYFHKVQRTAGSGNVNLNYYYDNVADGAFTIPVEWGGSSWSNINGSTHITNTSPNLSYFSLSNFNLLAPSIIAFADSAPANGTPIIYESNDTLYAGQGSTFQWYLNGNLIPQATLHYYVPTTQGTYMVHVNGTGNCSFNSADYYFYFVGTGNDNKNYEISVFPNPFSDHITLNINAEGQGVIDCKIFNTTGQLVKNKQITKESGNTKYNIDINNLMPGVYFINVNYKNLLFTEKLIKFDILDR